MKYLFVFLICIPWYTFAAEPFAAEPELLINGDKCTVNKSEAPIDLIMNRIKSGATDLTNENESLAKANEMVRVANMNVIKLKTQLKVDQDALFALLTDITNNKPPIPVIKKVVSILEVASANCVYCDSDKTIAEYVSAGINISKTYDTKYEVTSTPTYIALVDGKEVMDKGEKIRATGRLTQGQLLKWQQDLIKWVK
jgi:hypothetical protein